MLKDLQTLARALGGEISGDQLLCPGPDHTAIDRSLSVKLDSSAPDGFLVHSFAGDDAIACKDYVRKKLGLERERPRKPNGSAKPFSPTIARYTYRAADGSPCLQVHRTAAKSFYQHHWDGEKWLKDAPDGPKIPYRLPELVAAAPGIPIYVVEGEKDCDNLAKLGFLATCNAGGADSGTGKKWTPDLNQYFEGRTVYVVADNDDAGRKHAQHVARNLDPVAASVRVVELPDLPAKGDVSDWLLKDTAGVKLAQLCQAAPLWKAEERRPTKQVSDVVAEIKRLAKLGPVEYDRERKGVAQWLEIRATTLDDLVKAARPDEDSKQGRAISFPEPAPWPEQVDGAELLDAIAEAMRCYVVLPEHSRDAVALWVTHTYLIDCFLVSPRLAICSPAKQCGKTTMLDVLGRLVLKPLPTANVTASAIFRVVEAYRPSLLVDEADTFLRDNDELRGIINSGHRHGGSVLRAVGDDYEPRAFSTYSACAIALIGKLPDTLHDRSVVIDLKRRLPSETISAFRSDRVGHLDVLARQAARWCRDAAEQIADLDPAMPEGIYNREADNWRPLLAIADAAGGHWPERARKALGQSHEIAEDDSRIALLLADIKAIFAETDADQLPSASLAAKLIEIEGRPWAEYRKGKPMTQNQLARALKPLGIAPGLIWLPRQEKPCRGYKLAEFEDAFERYLSPNGLSEPLDRYECDEIRTSDDFQTVREDSSLTVEKCEKPNNDGLPNTLTVQKGDMGTDATNEGSWPRVCEHCGDPERPNNPVQSCSVEGEDHLLHARCQVEWMGDDLPIPPFLRRVS
jgi:putative DNA primase/helicase